VFEVLQKRELISLHGVVGDIGFSCRSRCSAAKNKLDSQRSGSTVVPLAAVAGADATKVTHGYSVQFEVALKEPVASSSAKLLPDMNASAHANSNAFGLGYFKIANISCTSSLVGGPGAALNTCSRCAVLAILCTAAGPWVELELVLHDALWRWTAQRDVPTSE
jgi:hypothetical protein